MRALGRATWQRGQVEWGEALAFGASELRGPPLASTSNAVATRTRAGAEPPCGPYLGCALECTRVGIVLLDVCGVVREAFATAL